MFRLPNIPAVDASHPTQANSVELADLWEIMALQSERGSASLEAIKSALQLASDPNPDTDAEADIELEGMLGDVLLEISDRGKSCGPFAPTYPFFAREREVCITKPLAEESYVYLFLLLVTRFNMTKERTQGKHDGTLLFEELCELVLGNLLGGRKETLRFGASTAGSGFQMRMAELCKVLNDDLKAKTGVSYQQGSGDDGLDIAAWIPFSDNRRGKHIIFAQCKTGSSWELADLTRLRPEVFCDLWMNPDPLTKPHPAFMSALRLEHNNWEKSKYAGLFFDRCRIMDYSQDMPIDLMKRLKEWVDAAMLSESFTMKKKAKPSRGRAQVRA